jgi:hypothetical protein
MDGNDKDTNRNGEYFISPSRGRRDFRQMVDDLVDFVNEDEHSRYSIVVGTDSGLNNGKAGMAEFVSVVTVHRKGKHGRYFWRKTPAIKTFNRRDRILKEASFSLELAQRVVAELRNRLSKVPYVFEIHVDVGENGPTREMIQEIVGMIRGNGFEAKIKPDAYAANKVADRYV